MSMLMGDRIEFMAGLPADFTPGERARFQELVACAGEVVGAALTTNIENARVLVMLKHEGIVHGVAALKRPQDSYRAKIMKKAQVELLKSDYPYELGYIFIESNLQGHGLSHRLVSEALEYSDGSAVFATVRTDNVAMRATLCRAGFSKIGQPYLGLQGRSIGLLRRASGQS